MNLDTYARASHVRGSAEFEFDQDGALRFRVMRERLHTLPLAPSHPR